MCYCKRRLARGSSLVEVMISLFVLMTALLGFAAMQLNSMQGISSNRQHTRAVQIASSIADSMRANRDAVRAGDYDGPLKKPEDPTDCVVRDCSASQLAAFDRTSWIESLSRLPRGRGVITRDATPVGQSVFLTICWGAIPENETAECNNDNSFHSGRSGRYRLQVLL